MKIHKTIYSEHALSDLKKLDPSVARKIIKKIQFYSEQDDVLVFSKPLHVLGDKRYRFRIGKYRAIFTIGKNGAINILMILSIKHRKDIYVETS